MRGSVSLRLDALYCAVVAGSLLLFVQPLSRALALPPGVTVALAAGVGVWAFALYRAAGGSRLRRSLWVVLGANVAAASLIGVFAAVRPWSGWFTILIAAVAVEVAGFAVSQAVALRSKG